MSAGTRRLLMALCGLLLLFAASLSAYRLPPPRDAPAQQFSAARAQHILQELVGDGVPHPIGSAANARLRAALVRRLNELDYRVEQQTGPSCNREGICGTPTNLIATLRSAAPAAHADAVLLAAHYDSVPAGPGAADDGAGVAAVLEIARMLAARPTKHPVILLLSDGEEAGLLGALLFVRAHPLARSVKAAVNLEGRGDSGPSLMFETGSANTWLMNLYRSSVARPITDSLFYVVYRTLPNDTDFTAFKAAGYQGYNFAYIGHVARYHTPLDTVANLSGATLQHQGDNALSTVLALADEDSLRAPPSDAVFSDVLSRALVVWPASINLAVAALALLLLLVETALFQRRGQLSLREIALGAAGALASVLTALALSALATGAVWLVGRLPPFAWIAHPIGMHLACAALGVFAVSLNAAWLSRRSGFWGAWFGSALLLSLLALALALTLPGASFIALLPAAMAALAAVPCAWASARGLVAWRVNLAVLSPLALAMLGVAPIASLCYSALGILAWPVIALLLGIVGMLLLPLLVGPDLLAARRRTTMWSGAAALAGVAVTLLLPTYSAEWPLRLGFQYRLDSDAKQAFWIAEPAARALPAVVAARGQFSHPAQVLYPGLAAQGFFAPAPVKPLAAPQLTVTSSAAIEGGARHYQLHLESARGAPEAFVIFPPGSGVREATIASHRTPLYESPAGAARLGFVGMPSTGVDFEIDAPGPVTVQLFDASYELPGGAFLQVLRGEDAASTQDGDVTVVQRTVTLIPAAGR